MAYRIPGEAEIAEAIEAVLQKRSFVDTQSEFAGLVRAELSRMGDYRASDARIRRVGIDRGLVSLAIEYREPAEKRDPPFACPVCGNALRSSMNSSLDGGPVEIGRRCTVCPYSAGGGASAPGRYAFSPSSGPAIPDNVRAVRLLERARADMAEASRKVASALRGTRFEADGRKASEAIEELSSSAADPRSLRNLAEAVRALDKGDPGWTRPTASIKNENRKDI
ncbi:MAG: hypothetical protein LBG62_03115 [Candidatus Methanoplasma sp.]|jgi:hypothetical protein|nr:hypothetical protein [Candidatus Methanoplasma sp.]